MRHLIVAAALLMPLSASAQLVTQAPSGSGAGGAVVIATAGPVTLTGIVTETNFAALKIPANTIGKNGLIEVRMLWAFTNSANSKTFVVRFASAAGFTGLNMVANTAQTTAATAQGLAIFGNNNATNAQVSFNTNMFAPYGTSASASFTNNIDTTADSYVNIDGSIAGAGETLTLQHAAVVVFSSP